MTSEWQRVSGLVTSADGHADRASGFLEGALVIALVESEPETPDAVTVTVAVDGDGRVAVVDADRSGVTPGPTLTELAEALAQECDGYAAFDGVEAGVEVDGGPADPSDPFDPEIDVVTAYVPDRSVVYTRAAAEDVVALADAIDLPVRTAPHAEGQVVLVTDGPALTAVEWPERLKPSLVVEQGAAYPAVAVVDGVSAHVHTWDADVTVVPTDPALAGIVGPFSDATLGTAALIDAIAGLLPGADTAALRVAIDGEDGGPAALVEALGLPEELATFLGHGEAAASLPGSRLVQPSTAFSRAVTDAQAQVSERVREQNELMRERAEQVRERAEQVRLRAEAARVRAESAFDAAETFTEEVVVPIRQTWWTPAVAAVEVAGALVLLRRAGRGHRLGTAMTAGERVVGTVGVLLLVDAVVNTAVFLVPKLRRGL